ncbi:hypothetical protein BGZ65_011317, partial [Modicella reniformis]
GDSTADKIGEFLQGFEIFQATASLHFDGCPERAIKTLKVRKDATIYYNGRQRGISSIYRRGKSNARVPTVVTNAIKPRLRTLGGTSAIATLKATFASLRDSDLLVHRTVYNLA